MEAADQQRLQSFVERSRVGFESVLAGVGADQWLARPEESRWSVGHCAEHIIAVEQRIFGLVGKMADMPAEAWDRETSAQKEAMVERIIGRETRVQAPAALEPTARFASTVEAAASFTEIHRQYETLVMENPDWLRGRFAEHPILKQLDGYGWILAACCHTLRHVEQIQEVKAHLSK